MKVIILALLATIAWFAVKRGGLPSTAALFAPPALVKTEIDLSEKMSENMTVEQKRQLEEVGLGKGSIVTEVYSPANLLTAPDTTGAATFLSKAKNSSSRLKDCAVSSEKDIPALCLKTLGAAAAVLFVLYALKLWGSARGAADILFLASNILLIIASISAPVAFIAAGVNPWHYASSALFWFPAAGLLLCVAAYYFIDPNFPVWKTIYSSLAFPALSGALICALAVFQK